MENQTITPNMIKTSDYFWASPFQNNETETILRNLVKMQKAHDKEGFNGKTWLPFTFEQYKSFCTHNIGNNEKDVIDSLVDGHNRYVNRNALLSKGWLLFDEQTKQYSFSQRMIEMLFEKYPENNEN